jgi:hypothetical protein
MEKAKSSLTQQAHQQQAVQQQSVQATPHPTSSHLVGRKVRYVKFHTGVHLDQGVHTHLEVSKHKVEMEFIADGVILVKSLKSGVQKLIPFYGNAFEADLLPV